MPTYEYVCRGCGKTFETEELVSGSEFRHMREDLSITHPDAVCGVVTRNWASVNFNRVKGGGRD